MGINKLILLNFKIKTKEKMSLYLEHRPASLKQVIGNDTVVASLKGMLKKKKVPRVYLFSGATGCGKTTLGRITASKLNCKPQDIQEINAANYTGIDAVRDLIAKSKFMPMGGANRAYIIDEVHKMTTAAQNAFLKDLEDTPKHVFYILCTTDPNKLLKAIRSRCLIYQVNPLSTDEMQGLLEGIVKAEKDKLDKKVYKQIISTSQGHPRQAIQLLEQVLAVEGNKQRLKVVKQAELEEKESFALCQALMARQINWKAVSTILKGLKGQDPEGIRRHVLGYAQAVLLNKLDKRAGTIIEEFSEPTYDNGFVQIVYAAACVVSNS